MASGYRFRCRHRYWFTRAGFLSADNIVTGIVHEFGHHLGLEHRPGQAIQLDLNMSSVAGTVDMTIEGYRLAPDGMSGASKSGIEGNAEDTTLLPLMWPSIEATSKIWVSDNDYQTLMQTFGQR